MPGQDVVRGSAEADHTGHVELHAATEGSRESVLRIRTEPRGTALQAVHSDQRVSEGAFGKVIAWSSHHGVVRQLQRNSGGVDGFVVSAAAGFDRPWPDQARGDRRFPAIRALA